jgi:hypothetical protein
MKNIGKKVIIYSMVGMMQLGFGATVLEASPLYNDGPPRIAQVDDRDHHAERRREHDRRRDEENRRHEREMRRHRGESEREWHERQERERERHDDALRDIAGILIGIVIGSSIN